MGTRRGWALFVVCFVCYATGVFWGLPSEFTAAADSPIPYGPIAFFAKYRDPLISVKYPAFHQVIIGGVDAAIFAVTKLCGGLGSISSQWPYGLTNPLLTFVSMIVAARLVAAAMAAGTLLNIHRLASSLDIGRCGYVGVLLFGASGVTTYYARVGNFDIPFVFWFSCALWMMWKYLIQQAPTKFAWWAAALAALSVASKDQAAGLGIGLLATLLLVAPANTESSLRHRLRITFIAGVVMAGVYVLAAILPQPVRWYHHIQVWLLDKPAVARFVEFENTPLGHLRFLGRTISMTANVISTGGLLLAVVGAISLLRSARRKELAVLLIPIAVYYLTILMPIRFVYERFMLPAAVPLSVLAACGAWAVIQPAAYPRRSMHYIPRGLVAAVLVVHLITGFGIVTWVQVHDPKTRLAQSIGEHVPPGSALLWRGRRDTSLPNAAVYQTYKLVHDGDSSRWGQAYQHVFAPDVKRQDCRFVLMSYPWDGPDQPLLKASWVIPAWISPYLAGTQCKQEYYLYDRLAVPAAADRDR